MYGENASDMPIGFAMALAHNPVAMNNFLKMDNDEQDNMILRAKSTKTQREMQQLADSLGKYNQK